MEKSAYTYILTNEYNTVLYTGVTTNLLRRIAEHRSGALRGFSYKYNCKKLVYFKKHTKIWHAINEEKRIKDSPRKRKISLIESVNPKWKDLWAEIR